MSLFLFDFILFFKNFFFRNLLFTVDRSTVTVHGYCWSQYKKLYCNTIYLLHYYIAIQFSSFLPLQYTLVYCNIISFLALQVTIQSLYCNTIRATTHPLQYTLLSCNTILHAIQYSLPACKTILYCNSPRLFLQYNSSYSSLLYNTKIVLQYNFHYNFFFQPSLLQYNCKACNTIFFFFTR